MELNKVSQNIYEIPQTGEMKKPARIYANDKLLQEIKQDNTLDQIKNVAKLPGLEKYSIVMPDGHQGYGFPIGGVAAVNKKEGVISPGGIGYDINCLTADSEVLLKNGRRKELSELKGSFDGEKAIVAAKETVKSDVLLFTENEDKQVFRVETETGEEIEATTDHPFMTDQGMKELGNLSKGSQVYVRPFKGVKDSQPEEFTILDKEDFQDEDPQLIEALEKRGLLPLRSTNEKLNPLLKLVGFHTGDGSFNNHGETTFYAEEEDLRSIQKDIEELGFRPSDIYSRERDHSFNGQEFSRTEHSVKSTSEALQKLMIELGAPKGEKTQQEFTTPDCLKRLEGWQKALYLSTFFGAEMSSPAAQKKKNLYCPKISQSKAKEVQASGRKFMQEIKEILVDLGVETNSIEEFEDGENRNGKVRRFRLGIKNDSYNLINFFQKIGYRYNLEKRRKAVKATQYLKKKQKAIQRREEIAQESIELYEKGKQPKKIKQKFNINERFIERNIYDGRKTVSKPPETFPDYEEFVQETEVSQNLSIKTPIKSIEKKGKETVYDIGVKHQAHNFIANQFIVSNCGVRVLKTDLSYEEVRGKEQQLANILYNKVPCGLGKGGYIDINQNQLMEILEKGVEWMMENGHAQKKDLEHCEENGRLICDPEKVPEDARKRGLKQVGSLGSGNHFLEVQRVENVFNQEKAEAYSLEKGQILVMIHSGSRGLGHQTCTEYLRKFEKNYPEIVESLPEKELIYAPLGDELANDYKHAMFAAANFAWANRQGITEAVRESLDTLFGETETDLVYDVCHNIAKEETHEVDGEEKELLVHRKGATRAMPAGREEVPEAYSEVGQPVLIPGSMGTSSYILSGGQKSLELSFGSTAHGAGRLKSRTQSKKDYRASDVQRELKRDQIFVKAASGETIEEEAPGSYKDVDEVIKVSDELGIGEKVVQMKPIVNVKG